MRSNKRWLVLLALVLAGIMVVACATPTAEPVDVGSEGEATEEPAATEEATEEPAATEEAATEEATEEAVTEELTATEDVGDRVGGWLDSIVVVEEPSAEAAFSRLENGDIDMYMYTVANPEIADQIAASDTVEASTSYGSYNEMTVNPAVCSDPATLNPFSSQDVRVALNWLIDRDYIVNEIYGGLAVPRYVALNSASLDAASLAPEIAQIEAEYAYDFDRANEAITTAMEEMGAELVDGVWQYEGAPVEVSVLIRTEDERRDIGDYIANQLEDVGFTVIRDYKTSAEASPLWLQSDPADCSWSLYTAGWGATAIDRDLGDNFQFFDAPTSLYGFSPLWQAYGDSISDEYLQLANDLTNANYSDLEQRQEMMAQALQESIDYGVRIWLIDRISLTPYRTEVEVAGDLLAAIAGSSMYPYTLRFEDQVGGEMTIAMPSILTEPWNPIGGSNWVYDAALQRASGELSVLYDPYNGLMYANTFESAEVVVQEDLPVVVSTDWVTLETAPEITVPEDVWVDWDAEAQEFITVGEAFPDGLTALTKTTVTYPAGFNSTWHDGSAFDAADIVMTMIMQFDQADPASPYYDESQVGSIESVLEPFRGFKIVSEEPFVIETYSDLWYTDAEYIVSTWWPFYSYGQAAWHNMAIALMTEANGQAALTADKAETNEIEYMSLIAGPSLEYLTENLQTAIDEGFIPFEPTLGQFITPEEATARYENLQAFFNEHNHYWIGTGPYVIDEAFPVEKTVTLTHWDQYGYPTGRWQSFAGDPPLIEVLVDGPSRVVSGESASFDVFVSNLAGEPYPNEDITDVQYLVFDSTGALAGQGAAEEVDAGYYTVTLGEDITSGLEAGSNTLTVVVSSSAIALPNSVSEQFVIE